MFNIGDKVRVTIDVESEEYLLRIGRDGVPGTQMSGYEFVVDEIENLFSLDNPEISEYMYDGVLEEFLESVN